MIKFIIFDLDGVLVTTKELHYISLNNALGEIDEKYKITLEEHHDRYDGLPTKRKLNMLSNEKGLPIEYHEKIYDSKQKYTFEYIRNETKYDERLVGVLKQLKEEGYVLYVASNAIRETVKLLLYKTGLIEYVDYYISNEDVIKSKPSPEIYLKCMVHSGFSPDETLIVEDSPRGIDSAINSKAHLMIVQSPEQVTYENIINEINGKKEVKTKMKLNNLNILIPMAGEGSRFKEVGYTFPKPLIDVHGKPMIQLVVENLGFDANYIYVVRKEHYDKFNLKTMLELITPGCKIIIVDRLTEGAACTTLLAEEYINNDNMLIIANSDQYIEWDPMNFYYKMIETKSDGGILTFESVHPKWSYVELDDNDNVIRVAEKDPISKQATCLHYNTSVTLSDGKKELIGKLVNSRSEVYVKSYNINKNIFENKKITGWVKKLSDEIEWYELSFIDNRISSGGNIRRIHITNDHKILTNNGYKRVDSINNDDKVLTCYKYPNKLQKEFIDGTLLGDGYYNKPNKKGEMGRLVIKQSMKQSEWFYHKKYLLDSFGGGVDIEKGGERIIIDRKISSTGSLKYRVNSNPLWSIERERWYCSGTKQVPEDLELTPLMMATWYMDDGSLGSSGERLVLCTDSFNEESIDILRKKLLEYNIKSKVWNVSKRKHNRIVISNNKKDFSAFNFFDLICTYIIPSMQYKLPDVFKNLFDIEKWSLGNSLPYYSDIILKKVNYSDIKSKHPHQYCIEVEDNHNFLAGDMVVSNCGVYMYRKGSDYVKYTKQMIEKNIRVNGEFYVAPIYNEFILDGKKIKTYDVDKMLGLGTPEDLNYFLEYYKNNKL